MTMGTRHTGIPMVRFQGVYPPCLPSILILADFLEICEGDTVTFTSTIDCLEPETISEFYWAIDGEDVSDDDISTFSTDELLDGQRVTLVVRDTMGNYISSNVLIIRYKPEEECETPVEDRPFILTIDTGYVNPANRFFAIDVYDKHAEDVIIDWGDNTIDNFSTTGVKTHEYSVAGEYQIKISGGLKQMYIPYAPYNYTDCLMYIDQWGTIKWGALNIPFGGRYMQGRFTDAPDLSEVKDMSFMFGGCESFNTPLIGWDTSGVEDMSFMFIQCFSFKQDISNLSIESATNIMYMLSDCDINETGTTTNYDNLLITWAASNPPHGLDFHGGESKYSAAAASARSELINTYGWTIGDGGLV